jgi:hypothetical protein
MEGCIMDTQMKVGSQTGHPTDSYSNPGIHPTGSCVLKCFLAFYVNEKHIYFLDDARTFSSSESQSRTPNLLY